MQPDILGNPLSAATDGTRRAVDDFVEGLLAYEARADSVIAAAAADTESCLVNAYAGMLWMLLEAKEAPQHAAPYLPPPNGRRREPPGARR